MKKRLLTVLLAVCLVFALGTVTAMADGDTFSGTIDEDVTLTGNVSLSGDVNFEGEVTLNTAGFTVNTNGYTMNVNSGTNLVVTGNGKIDNNVVSENKDDIHNIFDVAGGVLTLDSVTVETKCAQAIYVSSGTANIKETTIKCTAKNKETQPLNSRSMVWVSGPDSVLNFYSGSIDAINLDETLQYGVYGVYPSDGSVVNLGTQDGTGPSISTDFAAIGCNNQTSNPMVTINVYGGTYKAGIKEDSSKFNSVLYMPGNADVNIFNGEFVRF